MNTTVTKERTTDLSFQILPEKKRVIAIYKILSSGKTFHGVAKCNERDVFDPEVGKTIASLKMKKSFLKDKKAYAREQIESCQFMINEYIREQNRYQKIINNSNKSIEIINQTLSLFK